MKVLMVDSSTKPLPQRPARGPMQFVLAILALVYAVVAWRFSDDFLQLLMIGMVALSTGMYLVAGSGLLLAGVARHWFNPLAGKYLLALAAVALVAAACSIGNLDYLVGKKLIGTAAFGAVIALVGAWLAHGQARSSAPTTE
jgi:hypothetical protein